MNTQTTQTAASETPAAAPRRTWTVRPAVDVLEQSGGFLLVADIPGASPESVSVEAAHGSLVLDAQRHTSRGVVHYRREFGLPDTVDPDGISAEYKHGVLTVRVEKRAAAVPRRIEVRAA